MQWQTLEAMNSARRGVRVTLRTKYRKMLSKVNTLNPDFDARNARAGLS